VFDLSRITAAGLVARIDYHDSVGSTSDRALELGAIGEIDLPLLVLAEQQTAGRGRGTNRWLTTDGALTFSLVLSAPPDQLPPSSWPQVALIGGLAVCEALEGLAPAASFRVKWPNDVYLGERKIAGILSESIPGWRDRLVVGVGVNVNNRVQGSGFGVQEAGGGGQGTGLIATSLIEHDGVRRDLTEVFLAVLDEFDRRWRDLVVGSFGSAAIAYRQRCLLTGKTVTIEQPAGKMVVGRCRGIDDSGALVVQNETGMELVHSGTVARWDGSASDQF
jgi:BirA family transcriptional regulator, biotin operon repressor / biotin---[acetyl-CoA-carboxylase] ligase